MSTRVIAVLIEIDDEVSQGDETEVLTGEIENLVKSHTDPAITRTRVHEVQVFGEWLKGE